MSEQPDLSRRLRVAIIGCGNIAGPYATDLKTYPEVELLGVADIDAQRAVDFAAKHELHAYPSVEALLADERVDVAVNLTTHFAHKAVTTHALEAGKHIYSEKPLALTTDEARELVYLADKKGLRLGCSPFTLIGEAQQTAWKLIREGRIGTVRLVYAEVNWGRIESWHPAPGAFYDVGPLFDVGVYPLTIITAIFGPARRVTAFNTILYPNRTTKAGEPFTVNTADFTTAAIELANGPVIRLTTDFYVRNDNTRQQGIEFHGDQGSIQLAAWQNFDSPVYVADFGKPFEPVALLREGYKGTPWARGVHELVRAILEGRPHRFSGEQAAHVTEILVATAQSAREGRPVEITSNFTPPPPAEWAE